MLTFLNSPSTSLSVEPEKIWNKGLRHSQTFQQRFVSPNPRFLYHKTFISITITAIPNMAALSPEGHDTTTCLLSLHQLPTQWLDQHHQHLLVILPDHDVPDGDDSRGEKISVRSSNHLTHLIPSKEMTNEEAMQNFRAIREVLYVPKCLWSCKYGEISLPTFGRHLQALNVISGRSTTSLPKPNFSWQTTFLPWTFNIF